MTAQSIACGTCGASVPYGRLSCPSCGELLASVARPRRSKASAAASKRAANVPDALYDTDVAPTGGVVDGRLADEGQARDPEAELPWADSADSAPLELDQRVNGVDHDDEGLDGLLGSDDDGIADAAASSTTAGHAWAVKGASLTGPSTPAYMPRPNYAKAAAQAAAGAAAPAAAFAATDAIAAPSAPAIPELAPAPAVQAASPAYTDAPGAYVPPPPASLIPAGPPGPARAWVGHGTGSDPDTANGSAGATAKNRALDASRLAEFVGSVSVAGAALAAVGFLLPWASVMIGSTGAGYFDRWGLAGPAHIVVVIGILAVLALSIVRNPVPSWIRTGIGGLGVGSLLLGLTWPYLLGPLDAAPGVLIDAIGAIALIGSGVLAIVTDRHGRTDQPV